MGPAGACANALLASNNAPVIPMTEQVSEVLDFMDVPRFSPEERRGSGRFLD
jgi:hypothetical protein